MTEGETETDRESERERAREMPRERAREREGERCSCVLQTLCSYRLFVARMRWAGAWTELPPPVEN